jgi:alkylated DNA nucleotide flippase Atl1
VLARFVTLSSYKRFPTDAEFETALRSSDLYHFQRAPYFFRKLENHGRKEEVSTADYTIEHIMPQNENLSSAWREALGEGWQDVHQRLLHTLGNLTLTGYNPEYSDRPFAEKRDITGGFKDSPLRLNQGLGQLDTWNEGEIEKRAARLAALASTIWPQPRVRDEVLAEYRVQFTETTGFDWSATHEILEKLPAGRWTGYYYLAEAVGTSAQAVANHVSKCTQCVGAYRVLTWDGRLAEGFAWTDPDDDRDPRDVLEAEGIHFIGVAAEPEQKLAVEDLLALLGETA